MLALKLHMEVSRLPWVKPYCGYLWLSMFVASVRKNVAPKLAAKGTHPAKRSQVQTAPDLCVRASGGPDPQASSPKLYRHQPAGGTAHPTLCVSSLRTENPSATARLRGSIAKKLFTVHTINDKKRTIFTEFHDSSTNAVLSLPAAEGSCARPCCRGLCRPVSFSHARIFGNFRKLGKNISCSQECFLSPTVYDIVEPVI